MKRTKTTTVPLGILIREDEHRCNGEDHHIAGRVVTVEGDRIRNGIASWRGDQKAAFGRIWRIQDLELTAGGDNREREKGVYGFKVEYRDVYSADERDAENMLKTLRYISKGLARMTETRGYVKTFGEFVGRVAEIIGDDTVIIEPKTTTGTFYSEGEYWFHGTGAGVEYVNRRIAAWQGQGKGQAAGAAAGAAIGNSGTIGVS